jgi:hypothetical protein
MDAAFVEHLQDADVGGAERATASEHEPQPRVVVHLHLRPRP